MGLIPNFRNCQKRRVIECMQLGRDFPIIEVNGPERLKTYDPVSFLQICLCLPHFGAALFCMAARMVVSELSCFS